MDSSPLPTMPPELWAIVLENYGNNLKDLIHLWTQCRQVSKQFKEDVENTFIKQHLPVVTIYFELEMSKSSWSPPYMRKSLQTKYVGLSEDRRTALFSALAADQKKIMAKWMRKSRKMASQFQSFRFRNQALCQSVYLHRLAFREEGQGVFEADWKKLLEEEEAARRHTERGQAWYGSRCKFLFPRYTLLIISPNILN